MEFTSIWAERSAATIAIASRIFDLPEPLAPIKTLTLPKDNVISVIDLKFFTVIVSIILSVLQKAPNSISGRTYKYKDTEISL